MPLFADGLKDSHLCLPVSPSSVLPHLRLGCVYTNHMLTFGYMSIGSSVANITAILSWWAHRRGVINALNTKELRSSQYKWRLLRAGSMLHHDSLSIGLSPVTISPVKGELRQNNLIFDLNYKLGKNNFR